MQPEAKGVVLDINPTLLRQIISSRLVEFGRAVDVRAEQGNSYATHQGSERRVLLCPRPE